MVDRGGVVTEIKVGNNFIKGLTKKGRGQNFIDVNLLPNNQLIVASIQKNS